MGSSNWCLILLFVIITNCSPEISIGFAGEKEEEEILFQLFNGMRDQFYVDIGAFHPIYNSKTMSLKSQGWKGINVDASPSQLNYFFGINHSGLNLNYAIDEKINSVINFSISGDETGSDNQVRVSTIGLDQLCNRYYYRKPTFLNLGVQGVGIFALARNDWSQTLCKPDVILARYQEKNIKVASLNVQELLVEKGYTKVTSVGEKGFFIENDKVDLFKQTMEGNKKLLSENQVKIESYKSIAEKIKFSLPHNNYVGSKHYNAFNSSVFIHFAVKGSNIDLSALSRKSDKTINQISMMGRPTLIYNFDPLKGSIIVSEDYKVKNFLNNSYYQVSYGDRIAYIFNHNYLNNEPVDLRIFKISNSNPNTESFSLWTLDEIELSEKRKHLNNKIILLVLCLIFIGTAFAAFKVLKKRKSKQFHKGMKKLTTRVNMSEDEQKIQQG